MAMTKIVCTIGPACDSAEIMAAMIQAGMSVARLNFSHGTRHEHKEKIRMIRKVSDDLQKPIAILQDLAGPKIRVGRIPEPGIRLEPGEIFVLTSEEVMGTKQGVTVSYPGLLKAVQQGDKILLADGLMELTVEEVTQSKILCRVITGGTLTSHKGINLPTGTIKAPALTEKDREDLFFGLENDVDYVALSFVKRADDVREVKACILERKKDTPVIAKIEKHEAIQDIDEIMEAADGIMVARGDLGVEIPLEKVPFFQKQLIRKANMIGKPVITATQMLRSMVASPRPTRAEAADVANAVLDGTDAVMLSEETATGSYPVEAVQYMTRIVESAEEGFPHGRYLNMLPRKEISESVAHASCVLADHLDAAAIIATTQSGLTARHISRFRPARPILALSPHGTTVRKLTLSWGCIPHLVPDPRDTDNMIENAARSAMETGRVCKGDLVVITSGHPVGIPGSTNMVRVKKL